MVNITKKEAPITITNIVVLIIGQPFVGKSTLGNGAAYPGEKSVTIDFDGYHYRAKNIQDTIKVKSWADVAKLTAADFEGYSTIVIDTAGKCLDFLTADIIANDIGNKHSKKDGMLSIQGFGYLKTRFASWIRQLVILGKDIVMLAHDKEKGDDDNLYIRADITGGSYQEITRMADAIGYFFHEDVKGENGQTVSQRMLDFRPCKKWLGKNPGDFDITPVPHYIQEPNFLGKMIHEIKEKLTTKSATAAVDEKKVGALLERIKVAANAADINTVYADMQAQLGETDAILKKQIRASLSARTEQIKVKFDKEKKLFFDTEPPTPPAPPVETENKNGKPAPVTAPPVAPVDPAPPVVQPPVTETKTPAPDPQPPVAETPAPAPQVHAAVVEDNFEF